MNKDIFIVTCLGVFSLLLIFLFGCTLKVGIQKNGFDQEILEVYDAGKTKGYNTGYSEGVYNTKEIQKYLDKFKLKSYSQEEDDKVSHDNIFEKFGN